MAAHVHPEGAGAVLVVDLDETLVADRAAMEAALAATIAACQGRPPDPGALKAVLAAARASWRVSHARTCSAMRGVSSWEALWTDFGDERFDDEVRQHGRAYQASAAERIAELLGGPSASSPAGFVAVLRRQRQDLVVPLPGALERLRAWAVGHEVWLATHGSQPLQEEKLRLSGLDHLVTRVFTSGQLGVLKSEKAFADAVREQTQRSGSTVCAVVGDSADSDMALAANGGWHGVHVGVEQDHHSAGCACQGWAMTTAEAVLPCETSAPRPPLRALTAGLPGERSRIQRPGRGGCARPPPGPPWRGVRSSC